MVYLLIDCLPKERRRRDVDQITSTMGWSKYSPNLMSSRWGGHTTPAMDFYRRSTRTEA